MSFQFTQDRTLDIEVIKTFVYVSDKNLVFSLSIISSALATD